MKCNVGGTDRAIRLAAGITAIGLGMFSPMNRTARIAAVTLGSAALFSAITRHCVLNEVLGIDTCSPLEAAEAAVEEIGDKVQAAADQALTA